MDSSWRVKLLTQKVDRSGGLSDVENFIVGHQYSNTITSEGSPIVSTVWTISPFPTFLSFTGSTAGSVLVPLPPVLMNNPLIIAFAAAGECNVTCFVTLADGYTETVGGPITINSPTLSQMGGVLQQTAELLGIYSEYQLRYSLGDENGVNAIATVQSCGLGDDGQIAMMQVSTPARWLQNLQGQVQAININGVPCIDCPTNSQITYGPAVALVNGGDAAVALIERLRSFLTADSSPRPLSATTSRTTMARLPRHSLRG